MKKYLKTIYALLLSALVLVTFVSPAQAVQPESNTATPLYAVPISATCRCTVSENLDLYIRCNYAAPTTSQFTRVDITVYVEKRSPLFIWNRVDINQPNDEWSTICYGKENEVYHSISVSSGTYRVTSIFEVYNGTTLVETITKTTANFTC